MGLYKTECTRAGPPFRAGPIRALADLEEITSAWVHWYNTSRLMHRLGRRPPAEAEAEYYRRPGTPRDRGQPAARAQSMKEAASPPLIFRARRAGYGQLLRPQGRFAFPAEMACGHP